MARKYNFFAGPSVLPEEVLNTLEREIKDYQGNGQSMIETSHRGAMFANMYADCQNLFMEQHYNFPWFQWTSYDLTL